MISLDPQRVYVEWRQAGHTASLRQRPAALVNQEPACWKKRLSHRPLLGLQYLSAVRKQRYQVCAKATTANEKPSKFGGLQGAVKKQYLPLALMCGMLFGYVALFAPV